MVPGRVGKCIQKFFEGPEIQKSTFIAFLSYNISQNVAKTIELDTMVQYAINHRGWILSPKVKTFPHKTSLVVFNSINC